MNKIYKVIYNKNKHRYEVVSELAKSHGGKCKTTVATAGDTNWLRRLWMRVRGGVNKSDEDGNPVTMSISRAAMAALMCISVWSAAAVSSSWVEAEEVPVSVKYDETTGTIKIVKASDETILATYAVGGSITPIIDNGEKTVKNTIALGQNSTVLQSNTIAIGTDAHAGNVGGSNDTSGRIAIGTKTVASGNRSIALGNYSTENKGSYNIVQGSDSIGIGTSTSIFGYSGVSIGRRNIIGIPDPTLVSDDGVLTTKSNTPYREADPGGNSVIVGAYNVAYGNRSSIIGTYSRAMGSNSVAIGSGVQSLSDGSIAIGKGSGYEFEDGSRFKNGEDVKGDYYGRDWELPPEYKVLKQVLSNDINGDKPYKKSSSGRDGKYKYEKGGSLPKYNNYGAGSSDPGGFIVEGKNALGIGTYTQVRGDSAIGLATGEMTADLSDKDKSAYARAMRKIMDMEETLYDAKEALQAGANNGDTAALESAVKAAEERLATAKKDFRKTYLTKYSFVDGDGALGVGRQILAQGDRSMAVGDYAKAISSDAIAYGGQTLANGTNSMAMGGKAHVGTEETGFNNSMAIGSHTNVQAGNAVALGAFSEVTGTNSLALGFGTQSSTDSNSITYNSVSGHDSTLIGSYGNIAGNNSILIGSSGSIANDRVVGLGNNINIEAADQNDQENNTAGSVFLGDHAGYVKDSKRSRSLGQVDVVGSAGKMELTESLSSTKGALRDYTKDFIYIYMLERQDDGTQIGAPIAVRSDFAGGDSTVGVVSVGSTYEQKFNSLQDIKDYHSKVGSLITVPVDVTVQVTKNGVPLGEQQQTRYFAADSTRDTIYADNTLSEEDKAKVWDTIQKSISSSNSTYTVFETRRIQNVAPGLIGLNSTDAINGSQLFATNQMLGNLVGSLKKTLGDSVTVTEDGQITVAGDTLGWIAKAGTVNGSNGTVEYDADKKTDVAKLKKDGYIVDASKVMTFKAGKNIGLVQKPGEFSISTIDTPSFTSVELRGETKEVNGSQETPVTMLDSNGMQVYTETVTPGDAGPTTTKKVSTTVNNEGVTTEGTVKVTNGEDGSKDLVSLGKGSATTGETDQDFGTIHVDGKQGADGTITIDRGTKSLTDTANVGKDREKKIGADNPVAGMDRITYTTKGPNDSTINHEVATLDDGFFLTTSKDVANDKAAAGVKLNDTIQFNDGINTKVSTVKSEKGVHELHIDVSGLPVSYTDTDGDAVTKIGDKYYKSNQVVDGKPIDGATEVPADKVTNNVKVVNKDGGTTEQGSIGNVKSVFDSTIGNGGDTGSQIDGINDANKVEKVPGTNKFIKDLTTLKGDTPADKEKLNSVSTVGDLQKVALTPLFFEGDTADGKTGTDGKPHKNTFGRKLSETAKIIGGQTDVTKLTDGNIGVVSNGSDTLTIKLAKELTDLTSVTAGSGDNTTTMTAGGTTTTSKVDDIVKTISTTPNGMTTTEQKVDATGTPTGESKTTMVTPDGVTVTTGTTDGQTTKTALDKDGLATDGKVVVTNGKDGDAGKKLVTIDKVVDANAPAGTDGEHGQIGLDGKNGSEATITIDRGTKSLADGKNIALDPTKPVGETNPMSMDRITYTTKGANGSTINHEVATLDDGFFLTTSKDVTDDKAAAKVKLNNTIKFTDGANTKVSTVDSEEGIHELHIDVSGLPVSYTDNDGDAVTKIGDKYYKSNQVVDGKPIDGATEVPADQVTNNIKLVNTDGTTNTPGTISNVASGISGEVKDPAHNNENTFIENINKVGKKSDDGMEAPDAISENTVVNAKDLKNVVDTGFKLNTSGQGTNPADTVKIGDTINIIDGANTKVSAIDDTVNGTHTFHIDVTGMPISYTDGEGNALTKIGDNYYKNTDIEDGKPKDNAVAVPADKVTNNVKVVNKDGGTTEQGSIGNVKSVFDSTIGNGGDTGSQIDGINDANKVEKVPGTNQFIKDLTTLKGDTPADKEKLNSVSTVGDLQKVALTPLFFEGDTADGKIGTDGKPHTNTFGRKLSETAKIIGGQTDVTKLTDGNIGVVSNGSDTLTIKLAKELKDLDSVKVSNGKDGDDAKDLVTIGKEVNSDAATGTDGENGTIGLNGKNGSEAVITIDRGTKSMNDKVNLGTDPSQDISDTNTAANMDRITYTTKGPNNSTINHEVATLDDGFFLTTSKDVANKKAAVGVKLNDTIKFTDGANTKVSTVTSEKGVHELHIDVSGLPVSYTDTDGDAVTKIGDTYYKSNQVVDGKPIDGATEVPADQVTNNIKLVNTDGTTRTTGTISNVASGIGGKVVDPDHNDSNTFLENVNKIGVPTNGISENTVVNAKDLKNVVDTGFKLNTSGQGTNPADTVKIGDTIQVVDGKNTTVSAITHPSTGVHEFHIDVTGLPVTYTATETDGEGKPTGTPVDVTKTKDGYQKADGTSLIKINENGKDVYYTADQLDNNVPKPGAKGLTITDNIRLINPKDGTGATKITNVAAGTDDTDAVNVSQLKEMAAGASTEVTGTGKAIVTQTEGDKGQAIYNVHVDPVVDVVATDGKTPVVRGDDGKYYNPTDIADKTFVSDGKGGGSWYNKTDVTDGKPNTGANPQTPVALKQSDIKTSLVNPNAGVDPTSTDNSIILDNVKSGIGGDAGNNGIPKDSTIDGTTGDNSFIKNLDKVGKPANEGGIDNTTVVNAGDLKNLADTPLFFSGDSADGVPATDGTDKNTFGRKLSEEMKIVGGVDLGVDASASAADRAKAIAAKLTDGNIGVISDGTDTLTVKLAKELKDLDSVKVSNGKDGKDGKNLVTIGKEVDDKVPAGKDGENGIIGLDGKNGSEAVITIDRGTKSITDEANVGEDPSQPVSDTNKSANMDRITYTTKGANGDINHEVATLDDGFMLTTSTDVSNSKAPANVKLNNTIKFTDGANTKVSKVTTDSTGAIHELHIDVNGLPTTYVDGDGKPITKVGDSYVDADGETLVKVGDAYYRKSQLNNPDDPAAGVKPGEQDKGVTFDVKLVSPDGITNAPKLNNVGSSLVKGDGTRITMGDLNDSATYPATNPIWNSAVNVGDLKAASDAAKTEVTGTGAAEVTKKTAKDGHDIYNVHVDKLMEAKSTEPGKTIVRGSDNKYYYVDNALKQANDGKWYPADQVGTDGKPADGAVGKDTTELTVVLEDKLKNSLVNPNGNGPTVLDNVKSGIGGAVKDADKQDANTFLENVNKIGKKDGDQPAADAISENIVVNAKDLKNLVDTGFKLNTSGHSGDAQTVKIGETIKVVDGANTKVSDITSKDGVHEFHIDVTGLPMTYTVSQKGDAGTSESVSKVGDTYQLADGTKLVKVGDKFYKPSQLVDPNAEQLEVKPEEVAKDWTVNDSISLVNKEGSKNAPTLKNVGSGLKDDAGNATSIDQAVGTNAVNVDDLRTMGKAATTEVTGTGAAEVTKKTAKDGHDIYNVHVDKLMEAKSTEPGKTIVRGSDNKYYYVDNALKQANDGKWYPADQVGTDGKPADGAVGKDTTELTVVLEDKLKNSLVNPNGNGPTVLDNVKSGIGGAVKDADKQDANTFLENVNKIGKKDGDRPAADAISENVVVNAKDLKNLVDTGFKLNTSGHTGEAQTVKIGDTIKVVDGANTRVSDITPADDGTHTFHIDVTGLPVTYTATKTDANGAPTGEPVDVSKVGDGYQLADGTKLVKAGDKYYTPNQLENGKPKPDAEGLTIKESVSLTQDNSAPATLERVGSGRRNGMDASEKPMDWNTILNPTGENEDKVNNMLTNAANIGDVRDAMQSVTEAGKGGGFGLTGNNGTVTQNLGKTITVKGGIANAVDEKTGDDLNTPEKSTTDKNTYVNVKDITGADGTTSKEMVVEIAKDLTDLDSVTVGEVGADGNTDGVTKITKDGMNTKVVENGKTKSTDVSADGVTVTDADGRTNTSTATKNELVDGKNKNTSTATKNELTDGDNTNTSTATENKLTDKDGNTNTSTSTETKLSDKEGDKTTSIKAGDMTVSKKNDKGETGSTHVDGGTITLENKDKDGKALDAKTEVSNKGMTITPVDKDGNAVTDSKKQVSITDKGLNNGGNQIINVDSGLGSVKLKDATGDMLNNAVNVGDLKEAINNAQTAVDGDGAAEISKSVDDNGRPTYKVHVDKLVEAKADDGKAIVRGSDNKFYYKDESLQQGTDGKWYAPDQLNPDNTPVEGAVGKATTELTVVPQDKLKTSLVNPNGDGATKLDNIKSAIGGEVKDANGNNTFIDNLNNVGKIGADGKPIIGEDAAVTTGDLKNLADTPLYFSGDRAENATGQNKFDRKLSEETKIVGGAKGELSDNNIGVISNGEDTLTVKLSKNLKDLNTIEVNDSVSVGKDGDSTVIKGSETTSSFTEVATGPDGQPLYEVDEKGEVVRDSNGDPVPVTKTSSTTTKGGTVTIKDSNVATGPDGKPLYKVDENGNPVLDEKGHKIPITESSSTTTKGGITESVVEKAEVDGDKPLIDENGNPITSKSTTTTGGGKLATDVETVKMVDGKPVTSHETTTIDGSHFESKDKDGNYTTINGGEIKSYDKDTNGSVTIKGDSLTASSKDENGHDKVTNISSDGFNSTATTFERDGNGQIVRNPDTGLPKEVTNSTNINSDGFTATRMDSEGNEVLKTTMQNGNIAIEKPQPIIDPTTGEAYKVLDKDGNWVPAHGYTKISDNGFEIQGINQSGTGISKVRLSSEGLDNGGNRITHVAEGVAPDDAVNVSQLRGLTQNINNDIANVGANAAALAGLKAIQYDPLEPTQIMAAVGTYRGKQAAALGIAHYKNEDTMFHMGVSIGSDHTMANVGVTYKFGRTDEKKAVPDRYKAGPISSTYVLQDEMVALKEENARMRANDEKMNAAYDEILDLVKQLKQDNEEMKKKLEKLEKK